ncbi:MAG: fused MFS/spermidine synthase [Polyangiales bacterium]
MTARRDAAVAALFTLSGASGLVFELVWVRLLGLWTGHSAVAVSLVVAAFLAGLGLGNALGGRLADATPRPLRAYAAAEALTGLSALAVTLLLSRATDLSLALASLGPAAASLAARASLAFVVLLLPTAAMGATLPLLVRWASRSPDGVGASLARLYALNTLGAAAGCALAGFVVVGALGFTLTALLAAALDLAVAAGALALSRRHTTPTSSVTEDPPAPLGAVGFAALASGFASIACEVLWFRVLHAFVRSSTYAFTALLVVFLAGLVGGGALATRWLHAPDRAESRLRDALLVSAALVLTSVALLGRVSFLVGVAGGALRGARGRPRAPPRGRRGDPRARGGDGRVPRSRSRWRRAAGWVAPRSGRGRHGRAQHPRRRRGSLVAGLALIAPRGRPKVDALAAALYLAAALALSRPLTLAETGVAPRVALAVCAAWALLSRRSTSVARCRLPPRVVEGARRAR